MEVTIGPRRSGVKAVRILLAEGSYESRLRSNLYLAVRIFLAEGSYESRLRSNLYLAVPNLYSKSSGCLRGVILGGYLREDHTALAGRN
jgi:hypothetical protein